MTVLGIPSSAFGATNAQAPVIGHVVSEGNKAFGSNIGISNTTKSPFRQAAQDNNSSIKSMLGHIGSIISQRDKKISAAITKSTETSAAVNKLAKDIYFSMQHQIEISNLIYKVLQESLKVNRQVAQEIINPGNRGGAAGSAGGGKSLLNNLFGKGKNLLSGAMGMTGAIAGALGIGGLWAAHKLSRPDENNVQAPGWVPPNVRSGSQPPSMERGEPSNPNYGTQPSKDSTRKGSSGSRSSPQPTIDTSDIGPLLGKDIDQSSPPGSWKKRADINPDGRPASVRYSNPGAAYPSKNDEKYGIEGYGELYDRVTGKTHKIGKFPSVVHGAAANMDLWGRKYVGMTLGEAAKKWRGNNRGSDVMPPGMDPNMVITPEMTKDKEFMKKLFRGFAQHESGKNGSISEEQLDQAFDMYQKGGSGKPRLGKNSNMEELKQARTYLETQLKDIKDPEEQKKYQAQIDKIKLKEEALQAINSSGIKDTNENKQAAAASIAENMMGLTETKDRNAVIQYLKKGGQKLDPSNPWCSAFVNSSLKQAGLEGSNSDIANSFQKWGNRIPFGSDIRKGDVLVEHRNKSANETGGHVGMATGNTRIVNGRREIEMLGGNQGIDPATGRPGTVSKKWVNERELFVQRKINPKYEQTIVDYEKSTKKPALINGSETPEFKQFIQKQNDSKKNTEQQNNTSSSNPFNKSTTIPPAENKPPNLNMSPATEYEEPPKTGGVWTIPPPYKGGNIVQPSEKAMTIPPPMPSAAPPSGESNKQPSAASTSEGNLQKSSNPSPTTEYKTEGATSTWMPNVMNYWKQGKEGLNV